MQNVSGFSIEVQMEEDLLLIHKGAIAEQFVGQELIAIADFEKHPALKFSPVLVTIMDILFILRNYF